MDKSRRRFLDLSSASIISAALPASSEARQQQSRMDTGNFLHGVASGDPLSDQVIIWTRVSAQAEPKFIRTRFELALDKAFLNPVQTGYVKALKERDYTIKIDLQGLQENCVYYYRFSSANAVSVVGRTRTLATQRDKLTFAVFSCANYTAGYFNVYHDACQHQQNIDAVIHLGDYLYEYGMLDSNARPAYATQNATAIGRELPAGNERELFSLADYRKRYALYRSDPDLQQIHQLYPFICIWDDHEIADNTSQKSAQDRWINQTACCYTRKMAAVQAYYEWLPVRMPVHTSSDHIYRSFHYGSLFSLYMLDSRLSARTPALDYADYQQPDGQLNVNAFMTDISNDTLQMLGTQQLDWLQAELEKSGAAWQIIAQQVRVSENPIPLEIIQLALQYRSQNGAQKSATKQQIVQAFEQASQIMARLQLQDHTLCADQIERVKTLLPYNLDAWDGYPQARKRLYQLIKKNNRPTLLLSGDAHYAWSNLLQDDSADTLAIELGVSSVSAPGVEEDFAIDDPALLLQLEQASPLFNPRSLYSNFKDRGYLILQIEQQEVKAHWRYVNNITSRNYQSLPQRNHLLRIAYKNGRYYYR